MSSRTGANSLLAAVFGSLVAALTSAQAAESMPNRLIDYAGFQQIVMNSAALRESRRLKEGEFLAALKESGVVVLDARSASMFQLLHVAGAVNLPFTDFTADSLARAIPRKDTKIVIYCNNNFAGSPVAFATKTPSASLNLSTFTSLVAYGYTNVYELGPLLDVKATRVPFAGSEVRGASASGGQARLSSR